MNLSIKNLDTFPIRTEVLFKQLTSVHPSGPSLDKVLLEHVLILIIFLFLVIIFVWLVPRVVEWTQLLVNVL